MCKHNILFHAFISVSPFWKWTRVKHFVVVVVAVVAAATG
jgi:hypothetical protein